MALFNLKASKKLKGYTIITEKNEAKRCVDILMEETKDKIVACDTETIDLDPKKEAPVGNGRIVCASMFAGPEFNFGNGPRLFIDNFGENAGLLDIFKPYLESK
jgi:DNA polymerase-1